MVVVVFFYTNLCISATFICLPLPPPPLPPAPDERLARNILGACCSPPSIHCADYSLNPCLVFVFVLRRPLPLLLLRTQQATNIIQEHYVERSNRMFIINAPSYFSMFWYVSRIFYCLLADFYCLHHPLGGWFIP